MSFLRLLCVLRWLAIAGQIVTIGIATGPMQIALPAAELWAGVAALAAFNVFATWRALRGVGVSAAESFLHLFADIATLTWLVAWSGGIENPFSSLFLLPIVLSIFALPGVWVWLTVAASGVGYGLSAFIGRELPHIHGAMGDSFGLHKAGMFANFVVSALVIIVFFTRMASAWRRSEREVARLREQFARNEGIVALATHAASVAHELNTPLATLTLTVDDLVEDGGTARQREDFATLRTLLEVCRDKVRELAAPAGAPTDAAQTVDLEGVIDRWRLIRPAIELRRSGSIAGHERVDPAVGHLVQTLLNNAADAGEQAGVPTVDLRLDAREGQLIGEIRDYGAGFDAATPVLPGTLFRSSKPHGMGIGLALSHATVERLGGELSMGSTTDGGGVRVAFRLPVSAGA